jgi:hypothetical protein
MPAAAVVAVGTIAAAKIASNAQKKGSQYQQQSTDAALQFEREKYAQERADREKDRALAAAAWDANEQRQLPRRAALASLLRQRGINVPDPVARPYVEGGLADTGSPRVAPTSLASLYSAPYGGGGGEMGDVTTAPLQAPQMTIDDFFRRRNANLGQV